ncbi:MAG TPA: glycosyltransferase family 39 protein [Gemmataceae bacterium]|nr:glycosyltransferase family 39 protein [Gemmataceae bacterium]
MMGQEVQSVPAPSRWRWRFIAALLILGAAGLRLAYLAHDCPLDLVPDEAHYWDWSRHLDWSYYSKGPVVAWLIRASCELAGPWSENLIGNGMLAVRLPAVVCGALLLLSLYVLTVQVFGREVLAASVVALALTLPLIAAGASLMTIDAPYTCCWGWALVLLHRAIFRGGTCAWALAGLVLGIGILAKYTMLLLVPSVGLFLLTTPGFRRQLVQPGFWLVCLIGAACCLPILVWNVQHDWVSLRHVGGQAGIGGRILWLGPLTYLGTQFLVLLGFWFIAWSTAMIAHRPWKEADPGVGYLWWTSATMFGVFWAFSLKTPEEPNWPVTAYISGIVLGTAWLARQLRSPIEWYRRLGVASLIAACVLGLLVTAFVHRSDLARPVLLRLSGPASEKHPLPLRRFDPTCRLKGWCYLAGEVDRIRAELRGEGIEPILAASSWTLPGELGFYCEGHPTVYSLGLAVGDRWSQYDLWRPNPVWDPYEFLGRTFVFVGEPSPVLAEAFDCVDQPRTIEYQERGHSIARWTVLVCRGYRGFCDARGRASERGH